MKKNFSIQYNVATIKISKEIYPKEVIMQTTYVLLEKYYFFVDLDKTNYLIEIRPKENTSQTSKVSEGLGQRISEKFLSYDEQSSSKIVPKENSLKTIQEKDVLIFLDELIESSAYIDQLKRTSKTREIILEKALLSQKK